MRLFVLHRNDRIIPTKWGPDKDILREVTTLDDLLDLICWFAPFFLMWYKLWEHVYYREDDEE